MIFNTLDPLIYEALSPGYTLKQHKLYAPLDFEMNPNTLTFEDPELQQQQQLLLHLSKLDTGPSPQFKSQVAMLASLLWLIAHLARSKDKHVYMNVFW